MTLKVVVLYRWRGVCTKVLLLLLFYLSQDKGVSDSDNGVREALEEVT